MHVANAPLELNLPNDQIPNVCQNKNIVICERTAFEQTGTFCENKAGSGQILMSLLPPPWFL